jgi:hypothetical protein
MVLQTDHRPSLVVLDADTVQPSQSNVGLREGMPLRSLAAGSWSAGAIATP